MSRSLCKPILSSLLLGLWLCGSASATTLLSMSIDELTADAELIFEGEVLVHETLLDPANDMIYTYVTFAVRDVIKGTYPSSELELRFSGGSVNGETLAVSGLRLPEVGEQGIYFIESISRNLINPLLGWSQGHYLISETNGVRSVSTVNGQAITAVQSTAGVPTSLRRARRLIGGSRDIADGVVSDPDSPTVEQPLTVEQFKSEIRSLIAP